MTPETLGPFHYGCYLRLESRKLASWTLWLEVSSRTRGPTFSSLEPLSLFGRGLLLRCILGLGAQISSSSQVAVAYSSIKRAVRMLGCGRSDMSEQMYREGRAPLILGGNR